MSLASWLKEFYPEPIREYSFDALTAAKHSLQKWIGFRKKNLEKYGLYRKYSYIKEYCSPHGEFYTSSDTCSLCQYAQSRYLNSEWITSKNCFCESCPLSKIISGGTCSSFDIKNPYYSWTIEGDPEPMIKALEKVVRILETAEKVEESPAGA